MERLVQDFVAMQIRDRRTRYIEGLAEHIDPLTWLAREVSYELDLPITISEVIKVVREVQAVELRASSGLRVIVSTLPKADVMRFDRRLRAIGGRKRAVDRVSSFASVSYTHLRAHETGLDLECRLLLEKKNISRVYTLVTLQEHEQI